MNHKSILKVPNGKLLKIALQSDDGKISSVKITGDFFLHPENGIELIEKALAEKGLEEKILLEAIDSAVKENSLQLFGFDSASLVQAIFLAKNSGAEKNG
ncbi:MAG: lipoate protein ligase C-terminal domain-containing protein [Candidatus Diapherotrites archaeon]